MRPLRLVLVLVVGLLTVAFTGDRFSGCAGSAPPTGEPLPVSATAACFAASDCPPVACEDRRCISGRCVEVAAFRDGDEDGEPPAPCGMDCDDMDARVFPGAGESCNGRDDDCDTRVDEDAPPGVISSRINTADDRLAAAPIGDRIVLTDGGFSSGLRLRTVDFEGRVSTATPVFDTTPALADLAGVGAGAVLVVGRDDESGAFLIEALPVSLSSAGALTVGAPSFSVPLTQRATSLAVEGFGDSFAIAWDDVMGARFLAVPGWPAPVQVFDPFTGLASLDLASDGSVLAVPMASDRVAFFDATGVPLEPLLLPNRLADFPLASSTGDFVVSFRDDFDHLLARMTPSALGASSRAPSLGAGLPLRVDQTVLGVLVTRFDGLSITSTPGVTALLLSEDFSRTIATFPASTVSAGLPGSPLSFDVVASDAGTAVLSNYGASGAVLAVLACGRP